MEQILYIGISQSFFAGLMIVTKRNPQPADRLLAAWLFLIAIEMGFAIINESIIPFYEFVFIPFSYGPLLFLYIKFLTTEGIRFKWTYWLHFIPFLLVFISAILLRGRPVIKLDNFWENDPFLSFRLIYGLSFFVSITAYSIAAFVLITKHQRNIRNLFSYTSERITLSWLKVISISFYLSYVCVFIIGVYIIFARDQRYDPTIASYFGLTFFAFAFSFYGFQQPGIFREIVKDGRIPIDIAPSGMPSRELKYERSGLKEKDSSAYLKKLLKFMKEEKPYLDVDLTIANLAESLGIPRHYLTQVINEKLGKNFYMFINEYRVEEVKKLLADPLHKKYTFTAIAYEAGFNSKSSFNSIFKSFTGMTPSEFRNINYPEQMDSSDQ